MHTDNLILAEEFCSFYKVEYAFIDELQKFGLIELRVDENARYIPDHQLHKLEQMTRLHYDLHINIEGIDAIAHLLERVRQMQSEMILLKNRLKLYEGD